MELRNSVWNELCTTVGRTTTKMNAHFVPRFFICLQAVNTQNTGLQGPLAGPRARPHACSTSRFSLSGFLRHILGDQGATGRNDAIPLGESLLQELTRPWELILTEPLPEEVESRLADWAEKYFSAQSAIRFSRVTLSPSYTK